MRESKTFPSYHSLKRLSDLENKAKAEKKDDKNKKENFYYSICDFSSESKEGLNTHVKRKHTNLSSEKYPKTCDLNLQWMFFTPFKFTKEVLYTI